MTSSQDFIVKIVFILVQCKIGGKTMKNKIGPPPWFKGFVIGCLVASLITSGIQPVTASVNDNLGSAFSSLTAWLGIGKENNVPADSEFSNASLVEKVNYLEDKLDKVFQSASSGKTLLAGTLGMDTSGGLPTFSLINQQISQTRTDYYNAGVSAADGRSAPGTVNYQSGYNAGFSAGSSGKVTMASGSANVSIAYSNSYYILDTGLRGVIPKNVIVLIPDPNGSWHVVGSGWQDNYPLYKGDLYLESARTHTRCVYDYQNKSGKVYSTLGLSYNNGKLYMTSSAELIVTGTAYWYVLY